MIINWIAILSNKFFYTSTNFRECEWYPEVFWAMEKAMIKKITEYRGGVFFWGGGGGGRQYNLILWESARRKTQIWFKTFQKETKNALPSSPLEKILDLYLTEYIKSSGSCRRGRSIFLSLFQFHDYKQSVFFIQW